MKTIQDKSKDGGPAFPVVFESSQSYYGMSMRDYFAAAAIQSMAPAPFDVRRAWTGDHINATGKVEARALSSAAYEIADAMLAERDK